MMNQSKLRLFNVQLYFVSHLEFLAAILKKYILDKKIRDADINRNILKMDLIFRHNYGKIIFLGKNLESFDKHKV